MEVALRSASPARSPSSHTSSPDAAHKRGPSGDPARPRQEERLVEQVDPKLARASSQRDAREVVMLSTSSAKAGRTSSMIWQCPKKAAARRFSDSGVGAELGGGMLDEPKIPVASDVKVA